MQPWGMVQYPSLTKPVFTEPAKLGIGGNDTVMVFSPRTVSQSFFFVGEPADTPPEADTDLLTKWFQPPSEPYPAPEYPVNEGVFSLDPARLLDHETTFAPAWSSVYPNFHHVPQYPVYEGGINSGFQVSESGDRDPVFHGDQTAVVFEFVVITQSFFTDPNPEPEPPVEQPLVTMDSWFQPWSEPVRIETNQAVFEPPHAEVIEALVHHTSIGRWPPTEVNRMPASVKRVFLREVRRPDRLK